MRTIEQIVTENWYTIEELKECKYCNWCWWKGGINFELLIKSLPYFKKDKGKQLLEDLHLLCNMHDIWFYKWWNLIDFFVVNLIFSVWVYRLLHWTLFIVRLFLFVILYLLLNLFGIRYFNRW